MLRNVHRLGGGLVAVTAISWRASSPGLCRKRSVSSGSWSKMPPAYPALLMGEQSSQSVSLVVGKPLLERIGITRL